MRQEAVEGEHTQPTTTAGQKKSCLLFFEKQAEGLDAAAGGSELGQARSIFAASDGHMQSNTMIADVVVDRGTRHAGPLQNDNVHVEEFECGETIAQSTHTLPLSWLNSSETT